MEIYIVRHGKTYWNEAGRIQGWSDIELTEAGREVAVKTAAALKDLHLDAIYSSPLKRAYETACILKGSRKLDIVKDERIKEMGFGELEGLDFKKVKGDKNCEFNAFFDAPEAYKTPEGGESFETVSKRAGEFIEEISGRHKEDGRIMIVAHGGVNKAMMRYIRKSPLKDFWKGNLQKNCGVTIVDYTDGKYTIIEENTVFYE